MGGRRRASRSQSLLVVPGHAWRADCCMFMNHDVLKVPPVGTGTAVQETTCCIVRLRVLHGSP